MARTLVKNQGAVGSEKIVFLVTCLVPFGIRNRCKINQKAIMGGPGGGRAGLQQLLGAISDAVENDQKNIKNRNAENRKNGPSAGPGACRPGLAGERKARFIFYVVCLVV